MNDQELEELAKALVDGMADEPRFERIGQADDGDALYAINSMDMYIYMMGLKALKESNQCD